MESLRILQVIPDLRRGGAERLVLDITRGLGKHSGIEVKLLLLNNRIDYSELATEVDVEITASYVQPSLTKQTAQDFGHYQSILAAFKPHIIHSHLFMAEMFARSNIFPSAKYFCHFHSNMEQFRRFGLHTFRNKLNLTRYYERQLLIRSYRKYPTNFIAISRNVQRYIRNNVASWAGPIHLLPNAIDLDRFKPVKEIKPTDRISLVTIGRLDKNKNHSFLLDVVNSLRGKLPTIHLTIAGEGPLRNSIEKRIGELDLENHVSLLGAIGEPEKLLQEAKVYVHSAKEEGFGLTLIEAMACGLPVVSLDGGGNAELIEDGINGFLVKDASKAHFAKRIFELVSDMSLYQQVQEGALSKSKSFDIESYVSDLIELYKAKLRP